VDAGGDEGDRLTNRPARAVVDENGVRVGGRLDARGCVHGVTDDHPLPAGAEVHSHDAGHHSRARGQRDGIDLGAEFRHGFGQLEPRSHRVFCVILVGDGSAPDRHHGITDELLDGAAVSRDDCAGDVEVAPEQFAHRLGVAVFGQGGESDQVAEQHGAHPALGDHRGVIIGGRCQGCRFGNGLVDRGAAVAAEPLPDADRRAA